MENRDSISDSVEKPPHASRPDGKWLPSMPEALRLLRSSAKQKDLTALEQSGARRTDVPPYGGVCGSSLEQEHSMHGKGGANLLPPPPTLVLIPSGPACITRNYVPSIEFLSTTISCGGAFASDALRSAGSNATARPSSFLLIGIPGLEAFQRWLSVPLCFMYILAVVGNAVLLTVIKTDPSLREPMYLFLAMLATTDLVLSTSTLPLMLAIFWLGPRAISFHGCLAQMFFIHAFSSVESGILVAMALDRYVAICLPLRHAAILKTSTLAKMLLAILLRGLVLITPFALLLQNLPFCGHRVIAHSYCEHMAVVKLACGDTTVNRLYGLAVALSVVGLDVLSIALSYAMILQAVFALPSHQKRLKALSTCASHCCVILVFYIPGLFSFLTHRFGHRVPHQAHILLATLYLLLPPMLNPIVYGVKMKPVRNRLTRVFCGRAA
ncbi:PREDICTED: olfactory receptor 52R1-like [Gekko japonicus]|uniref:Olfactory receptor 52R1-like n=1 Tax=Gekko japonicus TaxID=146911 RepID=A0ABM1JSE9_GEKJA|nr:PREDICTED: olfactory receptor 52R1-like [Gekko japonicus]